MSSKLKKFLSKVTAVTKLECFIDGAMLVMTILAVIIGLVGVRIGTSFYAESHASADVSATLSSYGLNQWDWLAIIVAFISLVYAALTFYSQRQTEKNTMKITPESQRELLIEYGRHFYCNLIVICALEAKLNNRFQEYYPAEEHLLKLKIDLDSLHTGIFFNHIKNFSNLNQLKVKMRNFNEEIDVIIRHLTQQKLAGYVKERDFNTLKFKMGYLTKQVLDTIDKLWPGQKQKHSADMRKYVEGCAYSRNTDSESGKLLIEQGKKYFLHNPRFFSCDCNRSEIIETLFYRQDNTRPYADQTLREIDSFIERLNLNIFAELKGTNSFGSPKLFLIPFPEASEEA